MKRKRKLWAAVCFLFLLSACAFPPVENTDPVEISTPTPEHTTDPYCNNFAQVDASRLEGGFVRVRYTGGEERRIKVQITKAGGADYNYDLNNTGEWESFTLTEGNGEYTLQVLEHQKENRYKPVFECPLTLTLDDAAAPFRESCQFVHFEEDSPVVELARELCADAEGNEKKVQAVFDYVVERLSYDEEKAATAEPDYLPDVDRVLEEEKGICFDYAALMAAMLRSQGVACKLAVGYAGEVYHAWVEADMGEGQWRVMDPTFVSANRGDQTVLDFVSDPGNYKARYYY